MCLSIPFLSLIIYTKLISGQLTPAVNGDGQISGDSSFLITFLIIF